MELMPEARGTITTLSLSQDENFFKNKQAQKQKTSYFGCEGRSPL